MQNRFYVAVIAAIALTGIGFSCTQPTSLPANGAATETGDAARVGDAVLTQADLLVAIKPDLAKIDSEIYKIKKRAIDEWVSDQLLQAEAKKRKISLEALLTQTTEVEIADAEAQAMYNQLKAAGRINDDFEKVKPQIMSQLANRKKQQAVQQLLVSLRKDAKIEILVKQPRIDISVDDDPSQGPKDAVITLIEFSDFQCPYCKRTRDTIKQLLSTYEGKIHYVFRDFPLAFHKDAPLAHQATNCAGDQNKYWEYNTSLWNRQQNLKREGLIEDAKTLGLDVKSFTTCLDSEKYKAEIEKDIEDGKKAGVSGTPAYFINGRFLSGAQPFEAFKAIIDEELESKK